MHISTYKKQLTSGSFHESWLFGIDIFYLKKKFYSLNFISLSSLTKNLHPYCNWKWERAMNKSLQISKQNHCIAKNILFLTTNSSGTQVHCYETATPLSLMASRHYSHLLMTLTSHNPLASRMRVRTEKLMRKRQWETVEKIKYFLLI